MTKAVVTVVGFDEWVERGTQMCAMGKHLHWQIGDWWISGKQQYGERAKAAAKGVFGLEFQTLMDIGFVTNAFDTSRRREVLPFSYHREVAGLVESVADALLDEAIERGWPRRELRAAVSRTKAVALLRPPKGPGRRVTDLTELLSAGEKFGVIYADPPWRYGNQSTRAAAGGIYKNDMSLDEMCAMPVRDLAADDAQLHLWTTNGFLFECPRLFDAWGFEFKSSFVWVKSSIGIGNYWRNSHEILLTAVRGKAKRFINKSLRSWLECDRGEHSDKPDQVRDFIASAWSGPYLEMFARREHPGWVSFGNDFADTLFDERATA